MKRLKLGEILVAWGKLTEPQVLEALKHQGKFGKRVGRILTERSAISEKDVSLALSLQLGIPVHDFTQTKTVDPDAMALVPTDYCQAHSLIPISLSGRELTVAMADPLDFNTIQYLEFLTGLRVKVVIGLESEIQQLLQKYTNMTQMVSNLVQSLSPSGGAEEIRVEEEPVEGEILNVGKHSPTIRLVNALFEDAIRKRASDVHIEPREADVQVRYRVDGLMREMLSIPKHIQEQVILRVKVMASLDITNRRTPQDGRIKVRMGSRKIDMRVSTLPVMNGEKVVVRVLDQSQTSQNLDTLGFDPDVMQRLKDLLRRPQGIILVTGPTGSGKTTTLYAAINFLKGSVTNIVTVEDPVEYKLDGINQVQLNERAGLTFASGLRSILRQDPNVILVGEIRDRETADIAFQSAQTGHLVLSTLHTNDAVASVTRLLDIGLEPFILASSLTGVLAQRLVRRVCQECKEPAALEPEALERLNLKPGDPVPQLYRGRGCQSCGSEGYRGRCGVYELLVVDDLVRQKINCRAPDREIFQVARKQGMKSMADDGVAKAMQGLTSLEEVLHHIPWPEACPDRDAADIAAPVAQPTSSGLTTATAVDRGGEDEEEVPKRRAARSSRQIVRDRILVIDDSPTLLEMIQKILEAENFEVVTAGDGIEGLEKVYQEAPDLIVTDAMMPRMDGFALVKKLKEHRSTREIPVILLTSRDETSSEVQGLELGADDYITKPLEPDRLLARIKRTLSRSRQEN